MTMLNDRYYQLLTAYVDGELSTRQRKAVLRLLKKSADARRLLRQLQDDAGALRELPFAKLELDLSAEVVHKIRERRLQPLRRRQSKPVATVPVWTGLAVAASVLFLIGGFSYVLFLYSEQAVSVAKTNEKLPPTKDAGVVADNQNGAAEKSIQPGPEISVDEGVKPDVPRIADSMPDKSKSPPPGETTQDPPKDLFGSSSVKPFQPKNVELPDLAVVVRLRELDQEKNAAALREALGKSSTLRLEVPGLRDPNKGLDRARAVLRANGFLIIEDALAKARFTKRERTNYVIYAEDLTRDELYRIVQQLGNEDRKAEASKSGDGQMPHLVISKLNDYKELSDCLATEILPPLSAKPAGPLGVDPRRSVNEGTANQVLDKLKATEPSKGAAKTAERVALVAAPRANTGSPEVKRFLDQRRPVKLGSVQFMLVLSY